MAIRRPLKITAAAFGGIAALAVVLWANCRWLPYVLSGRPADLSELFTWSFVRPGVFVFGFAAATTYFGFGLKEGNRSAVLGFTICMIAFLGTLALDVAFLPRIRS
jgi:hypothetical protein